MTRGTNPGRDPPTTKFSGGNDDDKRGRLWGFLTGILMLFAFLLKAQGAADWPHLIAFLGLTSGGLAALIYRKK